MDISRSLTSRDNAGISATTTGKTERSKTSELKKKGWTSTKGGPDDVFIDVSVGNHCCGRMGQSRTKKLVKVLGIFKKNPAKAEIWLVHFLIWNCFCHIRLLTDVTYTSKVSSIIIIQHQTTFTFVGYNQHKLSVIQAILLSILSKVS